MKRFKVWAKVPSAGLREILAACSDVANEYGRSTHLEVHDMIREVQAELDKRKE